MNLSTTVSTNGINGSSVRLHDPTEAAVDGATLKQNDDICVAVLKALETSQNLPNSLAQGHQWATDLWGKINNAGSTVQPSDATA